MKASSGLSPRWRISKRASGAIKRDKAFDRDGNAATVILLAARSLRATESDARKVNAYELRAVVRHSARNPRPSGAFRTRWVSISKFLDLLLIGRNQPFGGRFRQFINY